MADRRDKLPFDNAEHPGHLTPEERRRRFAAAITKAEFGRFYWNDDLERRLREALERSAGRKEDRGPRQKPSGKK